MKPMIEIGFIFIQLLIDIHDHVEKTKIYIPEFMIEPIRPPSSSKD